MCVYGSLSAETCQGRGQAVASGEELAWILSSLLLAGSCRVTRAHPDIRPEDLKSSMGSDMQARVPPGPPDHSVLCKFLTLGPSPGWAPQVAPVVRDPPVNAGDLRDWSLIPGSGRSPGEGNGYPLQHSGLEDPMDRGAWRATVHGVTRVGQDWVTNTFTRPHPGEGVKSRLLSRFRALSEGQHILFTIKTVKEHWSFWNRSEDSGASLTRYILFSLFKKFYFKHIQLNFPLNEVTEAKKKKKALPSFLRSQHMTNPHVLQLCSLSKHPLNKKAKTFI